MCVCDIKKENSAVIEELNNAQVCGARKKEQLDIVFFEQQIIVKYNGLGEMVVRFVSMEKTVEKHHNALWSLVVGIDENRCTL